MLFSVANGKFHKLAGSFERSRAWQPSPTACGLNVTPRNYFETEEAANSYTGGRLSMFLCKHCATAKTLAAA